MKTKLFFIFLLCATIAAADGSKAPGRGTDALFLFLTSADDGDHAPGYASARPVISYKSTPVREGLPLENPGHVLYRPVASISTDAACSTFRCVFGTVRSGRAPPA